MWHFQDKTFTRILEHWEHPIAAVGLVVSTGPSGCHLVSGERREGSITLGSQRSCTFNVMEKRHNNMNNHI